MIEKRESGNSPWQGTRAGAVMFGGKAAALVELDLAIEIAEGINGVKHVDSNAVMKPPTCCGCRRTQVPAAHAHRLANPLAFAQRALQNMPGDTPATAVEFLSNSDT